MILRNFKRAYLEINLKIRWREQDRASLIKLTI